MLNKARCFYEFGPFRIDPNHRQLLRQEQPVPLQPKAFDILLVLVENSSKVVLKDDLMKTIWPDTFVEESNLSQHIFVLRKTLGEAVEEKRYIVTVPGRGYRFAETVRMVPIGEEERNKQLEPTADKEEPEEQIVLARRSLARVTQEKSAGSDPRLWIAVGAVAAIALAVGLYWRSQQKPKLTNGDAVVLADFANRTGDPVFDDTLKTALGITLSQSPFLNTLSDNKVQTTLRLMARPADTRIVPDVAREICQRAGGTAYIAGSIAQLGSQYLLTLEASNCQSGDTMAREQVTAATKERVIDALGSAASKLRGELGESLATMQKFDVSLRQATTPSLEALKAYSIGMTLQFREPAAALPNFERALELDPNFAMAYVELGNTYFALTQFGHARECIANAFALRDRTSELERLQISSEYYAYVTGELEKALQALQQDIEYKRVSVYIGLTDVYGRLGQYEKAAEAARTLVARDPDFSLGLAILASDDLALQDFSGLRQAIQQVQARGVDRYSPHYYLYRLAFEQGDSAGMANEQRWFLGQPTYEGGGLALAADTEAYAGHLKKARELTTLAAESAVREGNKDGAASYWANGALRQAAYGNAAEARRSATVALKLAPGNPNVAVQAALVFAMTAEAAQAERLVQDLGKHFPLDTQMQLLGLPTVQAQLQLGQQKPDLALNTLRAGLPIEYANTSFSDNISCLYPTYIRGQAYLAARQGAAAAGEFQKIIDHNGIVGNCWTGALAHLGIGRANGLLSTTSEGDQATVARKQARDAYRKFLILWKDADLDIPILKQAKAEYAKLR
jgi:eukaryotic-like serine/threonine-protein kinase